MATLIPASDTPREVLPANGRAFTVPEIQFLVGGCFEVLALEDGRLMLLNEDGKRLQLPSNPAATHLMASRLLLGDSIVGDVVICTFAEMGE